MEIDFEKLAQRTIDAIVSGGMIGVESDHYLPPLVFIWEANAKEQLAAALRDAILEQEALAAGVEPSLEERVEALEAKMDAVTGMLCVD